ncbi:MAG: hypothetical protein HC880_01070 [Bacteroidia bacterium]|nr:hypothetical protein [Bacteroidia bacterium]
MNKIIHLTKYPDFDEIWFGSYEVVKSALNFPKRKTKQDAAERLMNGFM